MTSTLSMMAAALIVVAIMITVGGIWVFINLAASIAADKDDDMIVVQDGGGLYHLEKRKEVEEVEA